MAENQGLAVPHLAEKRPEVGHEVRKVRPDGYMRQTMPEVSAFIDSMRAAFGVDEINAALRLGKAAGTFWAAEGDQVVGAPRCDWPRPVNAGEMVIGAANVKKAKR